METVMRLGPADQGRKMSLEEFQAGEYERGYHYELIDGKLAVSPEANFPEYFVERWLYLRLERYVLEHPEVVGFASNKARVFLPDRRTVTAPEPDIAVYKDLPPNTSFDDVQWEDISPLLVVEVLSADDPDKDLVRNARLYFQVPSIREYWVIDSRVSATKPTMSVHRRYGKRWRILEIGAGETYTTRLLPGFELRLDLHQ